MADQNGDRPRRAPAERTASPRYKRSRQLQGHGWLERGCVLGPATHCSTRVNRYLPRPTPDTCLIYATTNRASSLSCFVAGAASATRFDSEGEKLTTTGTTTGAGIGAGAIFGAVAVDAAFVFRRTFFL